MIQEIQELLDKYTAWLRDNTTLREVEDSVEITTPYLDRNNDYIQIYAKRANGGFILTDDSYTIEDLRMSGCNIETQKRQELLKLTLNGFGVMLNKEALEVHTSRERFALQKHNLLQAILAVTDLFYLAEPVVKSLFLEDVTSWLDLNEIRYTSKVKFTGKTGYDHCFDFVIPKSRKQPERILQTISRPSKAEAESVVFKWFDTKETRAPDSKMFAILNENEHG